MKVTIRVVCLSAHITLAYFSIVSSQFPDSDSNCQLLSCGGRTRTCDLQVMSLASYQLLHPAICSVKSFGIPLSLLRVQRYDLFSTLQNKSVTFLIFVGKSCESAVFSVSLQKKTLTKPYLYAFSRPSPIVHSFLCGNLACGLPGTNSTCSCSRCSRSGRYGAVASL